MKITVLLDILLCRMLDKSRLFRYTLSVRPSGWPWRKKRYLGKKIHRFASQKSRASSFIECRSTHYSCTWTSQTQCVTLWSGFNWLGLISRRDSFANDNTPSVSWSAERLSGFQGWMEWIGAWGLVVRVVDSFFREEPDDGDFVFLWDAGFSWRGSAEWLGFRLEDLGVTVRFQTEADIFGTSQVPYQPLRPTK